MYAVNFTQILNEGIQVADPNWPTQPCNHGWEFDKDELPYSTISTEVNSFIRTQIENQLRLQFFF